MLAFTLSLSIFLSCFVVGFSVLPKNQINNDKYLNFLLSPVMGLAILVIILNFASRLGFPVENLVWPLLGLLGISLIITLRRFRQTEHPLKKLVLLFTLPATTLFGGWPILRYGFNWLSYLNDDMNFYVMGATRFYNGGFYTKPGRSLLDGTDYSQYLYHIYVTIGARPGSELFLAFVGAFHGARFLQIFMPTILALQMVLAITIVGLVRVTIGEKRWQSVTAIVLATILPLMNLGFLYQLIAQVGGLSFAIATLILVTIVLKEENGSRQTGIYIFLAIVISGQLIWYPEVLPFIVMPIILMYLLSKNINRRRLWLGSIGSLVLSFLILNRYFLQAVRYSFFAVTSTTNSNVENKLQLFPYFLRPTGLPAIFGFAPLNRPFGQTTEAVSILVSLVLILILGITAFIKPRRSNSFVSVALLMFAALAYLIHSDNGFGSFKLAMYLQPFLICMIILLLQKSYALLPSSDNSRWIFRSLLTPVAVAFCFLIVETSQYYSSASTGTKNNGFSELREANSSGIVNQIVNAERAYVPSIGLILSPAPILSQVHLEAIASKGKAIAFLSRDPIQGAVSTASYGNSPIARTTAMFTNGHAMNNFQQLQAISKRANGEFWYLIPNDIFSSINKSSHESNKGFWNYQLIKNPQNYLVFINSSAGHISDDISSTQNSDALFPSERNPLVPNSYMQSVGDTLLLQVVNFQPNSSLTLNLSSTVLSQYFRRIPNVTVIGSNVVVAQPVGAGSARLIIPNVSPLKINNQNYFEIKFDQKLKPFPAKSSWLANIYGSRVVTDARMISTFLSDLSLISPDFKTKSEIPSQVNAFPKDLENPRLIYSGAYEDGWMSPSFYFDLKAMASNVINVSGFIPEVGKNQTFKTSMTAYIDGVATRKFDMNLGNFNLDIRPKVPLVPGSTHRIEFKVEKSQILPVPDGRPASIFLTYLGFKGGN